MVEKKLAQKKPILNCVKVLRVMRDFVTNNTTVCVNEAVSMMNAAL